ncbi:pentapeptide repeat-containing protein [Lentzea cavernae]|uniref:Pentapeptide repeat-containing protein n=1 Tax=Lentzea cavernae TaxID=2020703 RepID=A0ABQ3MFK6_9PSEU|nr:pentapeptide repeat-containing protein [Lentzea cavernae]GHH44044.1 hypothetical protein GCM10017774_42860 [Lentzea cavernae]
MSDKQNFPAYRVLSTRTIVWAAVGLMVVGVGLAAWLLLAYGGGTDADKARLEAIKTAGTIVVGTGGAAALWLAARRQQTSEIALRQKDKDQAHQERVAAHTEAVAAATQAHQERVALQSEHDAAERRVTELYTRAVEQLGSEKAPIRLGGMYALERLAQNVPGQRQTIVNVLCAYLRMPYLPPALRSSTGKDAAVPAPPPSASRNVETEPSGKTNQAEDERCHQERQVRLTAQRILSDHLRPVGEDGFPNENFWSNIDLELIGATLLDFDLTRCRIGIGRFHGAWFSGYAGFKDARFDGHAGFGSVRFSREAEFSRTSFERYAMFGDAEFDGPTRFSGAHFSLGCAFSGGQFASEVTFSDCRIAGEAKFREARARVDLDTQREWPTGYIELESPDARDSGTEGRWAYVIRQASEE